MSVDSSDIDNALVAKLGADVTLLSYCPNGVFWDVAPPGATRFVIVSLDDQFDTRQFDGRAFEVGTYMVKAVMLSTVAGANIKAAAARIDALLEGGTLTAAGYSLMTMARESRIRTTEVDDVDASIRWQHRGGRYQVWMTESGVSPVVYNGAFNADAFNNAAFQVVA